MVRASRRDRRALVPHETPENTLAERVAGRELRAQIGEQPLRIPAAQLLQFYARQLRQIQDAQKNADPITAVLFTGIKQSLNIMIPLLRQFIKLKAPDLPPLPERPRHTDPIVFLLGYVYGVAIDTVTLGEWIVPVDETGEAGEIEWTYAEEFARQVEQVKQARARQAALSDALPDEEGTQ